ncbi:MAG: hypothetical protein H7301_11455 [Cryobacterium sp.]|nr:hypothetical protein [Oligoflexia bacterium]
MGLLRIVFLMLATLATAHAAHAKFSEGQIALKGSLGSEQSSSLGAREKLKWADTELRANETRQTSPLSLSNPGSGDQTTNTWGLGMEQGVSTETSLSLELDRLTDEVEKLGVTGVKISFSNSPWEFSFRQARSKIDEPYTLAGKTFQNALLNQSTFEMSYDLDLGESDFLTPSLSVSAFNPDLSRFSSALDTKRIKKTNSGISANFQNIIQNYEKWSTGIFYGHGFDDHWSASISARISKIPVVNQSILLSLAPSLSKRWNPFFTTQLGIDYSNVSGQKIWSTSLDLKFTIKPALARK